MKTTSKITLIAVALSILLVGAAVPLSTHAGEEADIVALQEIIETLKQQIAELQVKITAFKQARAEVRQAAQEVKKTLKLTRQLRQGMSSEDVRLLQELLSTDPEIYPEGLVTGYFGPLTNRAVKKFQKAVGFEQVGQVGPKTLAKINELLKEGAGASGKVPPGFLIAPGIRKKLGFTPEPLPGQKLPFGIAKKLEEEPTPDTTPPVITELMAIETTTTSTKITWKTDEKADSTVWYDTSTPVVAEDPTPMVSSSDFVLEHEVAIFDLNAGTIYYYLASSTDMAGNTTTSAEDGVTTLSE